MTDHLPHPASHNPSGTPSRTTEICLVCGLSPKVHRAAEEAGSVHHMFNSRTPTLIPTPQRAAMASEASEDTPQVSARRTVIPADALLRMLLIRKGIIKADELATLENELRAAGIVVAPPAHMVEGPSGPVPPYSPPYSDRSSI